jgi:CheY-like chemotaxis protein
VKIRVAVVDDELFFREAITEVLDADGIDCVTAENGHRALELADDPEIGVMLLDIRMPGMDGIEVLRRLREQRPNLRVLVLSASTDQETVLEALRLGASDYLAKPLHDEELVFAVKRGLESYALSADSAQLRTRLGRVVTLTEELSQGAGARVGDDRRDYLYRAAVEGAAELLRARRTSLLVRDADPSGSTVVGNPATLSVVAAVGAPAPVDEMTPATIGEGVAGRVAERGEALLVTARSEDGRFADEPVPGRYDSDCFIVVPLFGRSLSAGGAGTLSTDLLEDSGSSLAEAVMAEEDAHEHTFGVLCATDPKAGGVFAAEDLALLRLLGGRVAELLSMSSSPAETEEAEEVGASTSPGSLDGKTVPVMPGLGGDRDAELVRGICDALVNEVEPERVLRAVLEPIARELSAAPVSLYMIDGGTGELVCEAQLDGGVAADRKTLPPSSGLTGTVLQSGNLVATQSPELDPRYDVEVDTPEDGTPSPLLCVPLRLRGKVVGLCRAFLPGEVIASPRTGEAVAAALSAAIRNVLLYRSLVESIEEVAEARRQSRH